VFHGLSATRARIERGHLMLRHVRMMTSVPPTAVTQVAGFMARARSTWPEYTGEEAQALATALLGEAGISSNRRSRRNIAREYIKKQEREDRRLDQFCGADTCLTGAIKVRVHSRLDWMSPSTYAAARRSAALRYTGASAQRTASTTPPPPPTRASPATRLLQFRLDKKRGQRHERFCFVAHRKGLPWSRRNKP
jgi:hypothetical protein